MLMFLCLQTYHLFVSGTVVKQADTVLLSYPLMYPQSKVAKEKMIRKYAGVNA